MSRSAIIHAHFYQPPREEPWLELVPREPSAAPDHDWNERITRECYRPLAAMPLRDAEDRITGVVNCYEWLSFDAGPTLVRWLEHHAPDVVDAMVIGDRRSIERTGHGNAIAAPYHHVILPLASRADKVTEIRWGMREFRRIFGRDSLGLWLPETAVDEETLEVAAEEGIRFVVLAPHQIDTVPADGGPTLWRGSAGKEMVLCAYDGLLAHEVAFGGLASDPLRFADRLAGSPDDQRAVISLATDGETFGHHHRDAAAGLAATIATLTDHADRVQLTNYAAIMPDDLPLTGLKSRTSWSCSHGLGRWLENCGCRMDPHTSQTWRTPLRNGLERLATGIHAIAAREWPATAGNREEIRNDAGPELNGVPDLPQSARRLLEAERLALAMFTSCAWFFDDLGRIEPRLVLRHAARALEFLPREDAVRLETELLDTLAAAHSNDPAKGSGVDIWYRDVLIEASGPARLAAAVAALREIDAGAIDTVYLPTHEWRMDGGIITTIHRRTGVSYRWHTDPVTFGMIPARVHVRMLDGAGIAHLMTIASYPAPFRSRMVEMVGPAVMTAAFDGEDQPMIERTAPPVPPLHHALTRARRRLDLNGLAGAATLVHAVLDLMELTEVTPEDAELAELWSILDPMPQSPERRRLAERLSLVLS